MHRADEHFSGNGRVTAARAGHIPVIGVGGPVGSGKTALVEALCLRLRDRVSLAVVTNDIFTKEDAIAAFLYQAATGFVAAAMKLMPLGQREGQRLLESWTEVIERISQKAVDQRVLQSWSPVQDIYAMKHSRLESRLFRS